MCVTASMRAGAGMGMGAGAGVGEGLVSSSFNELNPNMLVKVRCPAQVPHCPIYLLVCQ
jgi:hypothetical protein